jgi:hypothetical protein
MVRPSIKSTDSVSAVHWTALTRLSKVGDLHLLAAFEGRLVGDDAGGGEGYRCVDVDCGFAVVENGVDEFVG